jgi:hypothetical protein
MAIVQDAVSTHTASAGATATKSHTVGVGNNAGLLLLVVLDGQSVNPTEPTATYAGVSMISAVTTLGGHNQRATILYLPAPAVGANNCVVNWTGTSVAKLTIVSLLGVSQGSMVRSGSETIVGSYGNDPSISVPSAIGDLVVDCLACRALGIAPIVGSGQTAWYSGVDGIGIIWGMSYEAGASPTTTMSWDTDQTATLCGLSVAPASDSNMFIMF